MRGLFSHSNGSEQDDRSNGGAGVEVHLVSNRTTTPTPSEGEGERDGERDGSEKIGWQFPTLVVVLFLVGLGAAIGHHVYYQSLDGQLVAGTSGIDDADGSSSRQQTWAIRIGTGLAFLHKTALVGVLGLVGAQQAWATVRRRAMTVNGIDSMFAAVGGSPLGLLSGDVVSQAKTVVLVAAAAWSVPLVAMVTPATLSVRSQLLATTAAMDVLAGNFSDAAGWVTTAGPGYVTGPSVAVATLFSNVYSSYGFVAVAAPAANASYTQTLYGPSYRCVSLAEAVATQNAPTWSTTEDDAAPFQAYSNYTSLEAAFYGELGVARTSSADDHYGYDKLIYSAAAPDYMDNVILLSALGTNTQWQTAHDGNVTTFANGTVDAPAGSNVVCQLYNTSFTVAMRFVDGVQTVVPLDVQLLEPQRFSAGAAYALLPCADDPYIDNAANFTPPRATYYVTHLLFAYLLAGNLHTSLSSELSSAAGQTPIPLMMSALVHCPDFYNGSYAVVVDESVYSSSVADDGSACRNGSLAAAIEDLSRNFTYSTLALGAWANHTAEIDVTVTASRLFFVYSAATLAAAYAAALAATLAAMAVGAVALGRNRVVGSTAFSATLLATRNPQLDKVVGTLTAAQIGRLRLRFGHVDNQGHVAFGLDGSVGPLLRRGDQNGDKA